MSKVYSVVTYHSITDPQRFERYTALAGPAMQAAGARFVARGYPKAHFEAGKDQRVVVIEFDDLDAARGAYDSDPYRAALEVLGNGAIRDYRIVAAC